MCIVIEVFECYLNLLITLIMDCVKVGRIIGSLLSLAKTKV